MNNRYPVVFLLGLLLLLGSCKKYLDVQPETSYTESQVYGNESALRQAFNGLYLDMAAHSLYGSYMSHFVIEIMAQQFKPVSKANQNFTAFNTYEYSNQYAVQVLDTIWRKAYGTILAANVFLSRIDNTIGNKVVSEKNGKLLKGEALAIRAMLHFDMLRLFGPVYASGSAGPAIPYYTVADGKMQPILTAAEVMGKILEDLAVAEQLLSEDPVVTGGVVFSGDFYSGARNQRLNYFAVQALKSRVLLWAGRTGEAHASALAMLNEGEKWFPWVNVDDVTNGANPDRVFAPEILFGVYNPQLYNRYEQLFSPVLYDVSILAPDPFRLTEAFEGMMQDYRVVQTWLIGGGKTYRTFYKFAPLTENRSWRLVQPLIRKSELYLILAETEPDQEKALDYLNTERRRRGLSNLPNTANLALEIRKEYQKEFWGEGQLFFYYKRINAWDVPMATLPYPGLTTSPVYEIPLPLSETTTR